MCFFVRLCWKVKESLLLQRQIVIVCALIISIENARAVKEARINKRGEEIFFFFFFFFFLLLILIFFFFCSCF